MSPSEQSGLRRPPELVVRLGVQLVRQDVPVQVDHRLDRVAGTERVQPGHPCVEFLGAASRTVEDEPAPRDHIERGSQRSEGDGDVEVVHRTETHVSPTVMHHGRPLEQHGGDPRFAQGVDQWFAVRHEEPCFQPGEPGHLAELMEHRVIGPGAQSLQVGHQPGHETLRRQVDALQVEPLLPEPEGGHRPFVRPESGPQQELLSPRQREESVVRTTKPAAHGASSSATDSPDDRRRSMAERATAR